ncbi:Serine/threonine-protein kinase, variant 2 [Xanthoria calcicola]
MASHHEGINPHAASDLLRQAMHQNRTYDEGPDLIGSGSVTPSGAATPRPDPVDKRFPGIVHSFFGQVCATSFPTSAFETPSFFDASLSAMAGGIQPAKQAFDKLRGALPTAPASPSEPSGVEEDPGLALLVEKELGRFDHTSSSTRLAVHGCPTPPASSSSSSTQREGDLGTTASRTATSSASGSFDAHPAKDRQRSGEEPEVIRTRRQTSGLNPLSSIITNSSVHASHLSNPTSRSASITSNIPNSEPNALSARSALSSHLESTKLTDGVAISPPVKNTPPRTPRALSRDGSESDGKRVTTASPRRNDGLHPRHDSDATQHVKSPSPTQASPPVGPPKGKLSVKISEARGLKPSYEPYAVCVFEYNEAVARNRKLEEGKTDKDETHLKEFPLGGVPLNRSGSDIGRSMAIPMKSRQSSTTSLSDQTNFKAGRQVTDPRWDHEAMFDVLSNESDIDVYIYDRSNQEAFLGHVRVSPDVSEDNSKLEGWYKLEARGPDEDRVSGEIHLEICFHKTDKKHFGPEDFQIIRLIGRGTFGQVYLVRKKDTQRLYAMKVLSKKVIVQKKEVAHTLGERNILVRTAMAESPFIVGLKFSFQTATDLYLVTSYMSGGELFWHLQKAGRFNEGRAKFYIAELILALQHLHKYDIVYRDLKPENILLDANGHIALCDFGLSKANLTKDDTTNTFCGTTEYLAPEVLLDEQGYTTMVDFWSLGVLVFEMCCGWSPFYADDTQQMYKNIAFGKVRFPRDALSNEGRNFVKGLLNRNPRHRLGAVNDAEDLKAHPFFADMDWNALANKTIVPPFKPQLKSILDTSNFDPEFTNALETSSSLNARAAALTSGVMPASTPLSPGMQANFKGFTFVDESTMNEQFQAREGDNMDQDEHDDASISTQGTNVRGQRGDRMSGIIKTGDNEDGLFNDTHFDDI